MIEPFIFITSGVRHGKKDLSLRVKTMDSKWDLEKFSRDNNYGLWKVKMRKKN